MTQPLNIISLGAGVQSSTMALMAAVGEIEPMPDASVFSDTEAEAASLYRWLEWLERQLPFPSHRVGAGSLTTVSLTLRAHQSKPGQFWSKSLIPAFVKNPNGSKGIMGRACTADHKIAPLIAKSKEMVGDDLKPWKKRHADAYKTLLAARKAKTPCPPWAWQEMQDDALVVQWIGISLDEAHRMKQSRDPWIRHRWPLIEMRMRRHDCLLWMESHGYPTPPRSACVYCPFHSDAEWRRMREEEPDEFRRAVEFERDLQTVKAQTDNLGGVPYLHSSLTPLDQVDFRDDFARGQGSLFGNECEGLCGV